MNIEYSCFNLGTYTKKKDYFPLFEGKVMKYHIEFSDKGNKTSFSKQIYTVLDKKKSIFSMVVMNLGGDIKIISGVAKISILGFKSFFSESLMI